MPNYTLNWRGLTKMDNLILNAFEYVKRHTENESTGHDYHHAVRVYKMALELAVNKEVDVQVIALAALLHDLDDYKVVSGPSFKAKTFLEEHVSQEVKDQVMTIIDNMSFSAYKEGKTVETLEGKIVQDADRLDALGAIGIARTFAYSGKKGRLLYDDSHEDDTAIAHFYQKLFKLAELMNLEEARIIAKNRIEFMKKYLEEFFLEWK